MAPHRSHPSSIAFPFSRALRFVGIAWIVLWLGLVPAMARAQAFIAPEPEIDSDHLERLESKHHAAAWISLAGYTYAYDGQTRDYGALATLALPLDRMAYRGPGRALIQGPLAAAAPSGPFSSASLPVTRDVARAAVVAAWKAAGIGPNDARLDALTARAHWSALLPEARLRAARRFDESASVNATGLDDPRTTDSAGAASWLEARLTWRLDRILYADDEPAFERMRLERHDARARVAARVLSLLGQWQRAWVDVRLSAPDSAETLEVNLRLSDAEAALDVITDAWFGRWRATLDRPAP
ncbi:MAG TPA: hypothetical protein VNO21_19535 [Polyangiaceae bacterium]|nr:hypothetical protein [Polyangiaceae bacterium]